MLDGVITPNVHQVRCANIINDIVIQRGLVADFLLIDLLDCVKCIDEPDYRKEKCDSTHSDVCAKCVDVNRHNRAGHYCGLCLVSFVFLPRTIGGFVY